MGREIPDHDAAKEDFEGGRVSSWRNSSGTEVQTMVMERVLRASTNAGRWSDCTQGCGLATISPDDWPGNGRVLACERMLSRANAYRLGHDRADPPMGCIVAGRRFLKANEAMRAVAGRASTG